MVRRSVTGATILVEVAREHGLSVERCLRNTRIAPALLDDPTGEIEAVQELRLVANMVDALGEVPGLGLLAGSRHHLSAYGALGFALISSATVRDAIRFALEYVDLASTFANLRVEPMGSGIGLVLDDSDLPEEVRRFLVERDMATMVTFSIDVLGERIPFESVSFRFGEPSSIGTYIDVFGQRPIFDAKLNALALSSAHLERVPPQASPHAAALLARQCAELAERRRGALGVTGRVRDVLRREPGRLPDQTAVAAALHTSVRTLSRKLADEGKSFRTLVHEERASRASRWLADGATIEEVAYRLGYAGAPSFTHAFKLWRGVTPGEYARGHETPGRARRAPSGR